MAAFERATPEVLQQRQPSSSVELVEAEALFGTASHSGGLEPWLQPAPGVEVGAETCWVL